MSASNTEVIGFLTQLVQLMEDNNAQLKAEGLDVTIWITKINDLKNNAVTKITEQDTMQAALKVKTKEAQDANKLGYSTASTCLDAVMGVLGKKTPAAKQAGRLRSSIIKQSKTKKDDEDSNNNNK